MRRHCANVCKLRFGALAAAPLAASKTKLSCDALHHLRVSGEVVTCDSCKRILFYQDDAAASS